MHTPVCTPSSAAVRRSGAPDRRRLPSARCCRRLLPRCSSPPCCWRRACRRPTDPLRPGPTTTTRIRRPSPTPTATTSPRSRSSGTTAAAVECATLEVPLDYDDPDGEQIELYVARTPASGERNGALFINPGGPGAGAAEYAELSAVRPPRRDHRALRHRRRRSARRRREHRRSSCGIPADGAVRRRPDLRGRRRRGGLPRGQRGVRRRLRATKYGDLLAARRHPRRRPRHGRRAGRHGRRAAQLPRLQLRHRDRAGVRRPVPGAGPVDGARRGRGARARPGSSSPTTQAAGFETGARPVRGVLRRGRGMRHRGSTRSRRSRRCWPSPRSPAASRPRTPTATPARARRTWGSATALYSQTPLERPRPTRWPTPSTATARGLVDAGRRLPRPRRRSRSTSAVNCLDFAWPTGDPDAFFAAAKATAEDVAPLRRGARERLRALRRLARPTRAARAGDGARVPRRSW